MEILKLTLLALFLFITSCKPKEPKGKTLEEILSDASCNPPCWMEMIPGVTTIEGARQQLAAHSNVIDQDSIFDYVPTEAYLAKIGWQAKDSEIEGTLYYKTELLDHIYIRASEGKMNLADGIELYGIPEKVMFELSQCKIKFGDSLCVSVTLHYPEKGLQLSYEQREGDSGKLVIDPNQQIYLVLFFDPRVGWDIDNNQIMDWPGYGVIDIQVQNE